MRKILSFTFIILTALVLVACGGNEKPKNIKSIEVTKLPSKEVYFVNEVFSPTGGEITVTYDDGTTKKIELTAEGVTLTAVNTARPGKKTVNVTYEGKRTVFSVTVKEEEVKVIFNYLYEGSTPLTTFVVKGAKLEEPSAPIREGYTFERWYIDQELTSPYDFDTILTKDIQLYANWRDNSVNYYEVTFDPGYYGAKDSDKVVLVVEEGTKVSRPTKILQRVGYEFKGWFTTENGSTNYDFNSTIASDTKIYAQWNKTTTGVNEYKFEAEDVDLTGKTGPGFSGTGQESGMIQKLDNVKYVSFLYRQGITLDFYIASDKDVSNVEFSISLAAEFKSLSIDPSLYVISINDTQINYNKIDLIIPNGKEGAGVVSPFREFTLSTNVALKKGMNHIKLLTNNNVNYVGSGTIAATAPVVDYIKFKTDAVLIWDGSKGLPMEYDV